MIVHGIESSKLRCFDGAGAFGFVAKARIATVGCPPAFNALRAPLVNYRVQLLGESLAQSDPFLWWAKLKAERRGYRLVDLRIPAWFQMG